MAKLKLLQIEIEGATEDITAVINRALGQQLLDNHLAEAVADPPAELPAIAAAPDPEPDAPPPTKKKAKRKYTRRPKPSLAREEPPADTAADYPTDDPHAIAAAAGRGRVTIADRVLAYLGQADGPRDLYAIIEGAGLPETCTRASLYQALHKDKAKRFKSKNGEWSLADL